MYEPGLPKQPVKFVGCALGIVALIMISTGALAAAPVIPALPRTFDASYSAPTGKTINVAADGDFQDALNRAQLGDTIVLQAGATYTGPFKLPAKMSGSGWVYVRTSAYGRLPAPGTRVGMADAVNMPKILATARGGTAIATELNAHHYRFIGIEFAPVAGQFVHQVISLSRGDRDVATLPSYITFDRCYVHGDSAKGGRRGIEMDGSYIAVVDSYVADFKEAGADSQALWAYNSPGPFKIVNNYLEAAGENVMFGGADASIQDVVPSDIEIRDNYFYKPLSWVGSAWTVKNLLEFKNAQRALIAHNRFENNWLAAQSGFALLITPRNQDGAAPWSIVQDITFSANLILNVGSAFNISATDDIHPSRATSRVLIRGNVVVASGLQGAHGRVFQILGGPADVTIDHNTAFCSSPGGLAAFGMAENKTKAERFMFSNNIVSKGNWGFIGTGTGDGLGTLNAMFANWTFTKNVVIGGNAATYPPGNFFPATDAAVKFMDAAAGNYHLAEKSPYRDKATDGQDIGADASSVLGAGNVVRSAVVPPVASQRN